MPNPLLFMCGCRSSKDCNCQTPRLQRMRHNLLAAPIAPWVPVRHRLRSFRPRLCPPDPCQNRLPTINCRHAAFRVEGTQIVPGPPLAPFHHDRHPLRPRVRRFQRRNPSRHAQTCSPLAPPRIGDRLRRTSRVPAFLRFSQQPRHAHRGRRNPARSNRRPILSLWMRSVDCENSPAGELRN